MVSITPAILFYESSTEHLPPLPCPAESMGIDYGNSDVFMTKKFLDGEECCIDIKLIKMGFSMG